MAGGKAKASHFDISTDIESEGALTAMSTAASSYRGEFCRADAPSDDEMPRLPSASVGDEAAAGFATVSRPQLPTAAVPVARSRTGERRAPQDALVLLQMQITDLQGRCERLSAENSSLRSHFASESREARQQEAAEGESSAENAGDLAQDARVQKLVEEAVQKQLPAAVEHVLEALLAPRLAQTASLDYVDSKVAGLMARLAAAGAIRGRPAAVATAAKVASLGSSAAAARKPELVVGEAPRSSFYGRAAS
ncbi:unnamed protein product [Polarella glacialis]|nr:unnamed protein product [Polarella glacialis]